MNFLKLAMPILGLSVVLQCNLFADKASDDAAEKRRLENERQEQLIQQRKLEDDQFERRRQDQERINRQLEDRRQEQRRQDNRRLTGYELAARDRDRGGSYLREQHDRDMDDILDEDYRERRMRRSRNHKGCSSCKNPTMTCQDKNMLNDLEAQEECEEKSHEQRVNTIEQWDWDHSRD